MAKKAVIIGSGIAGIAAAIRLRTKGYEVTVYEKNNYPGGKLTVVKKNGFRFDAGPSVFTLPELVLELFELAGKNPNDYFQYVRHSVSSNYFWKDGSQFSAPGNKDQFIEKASKEFGIDQRKLERYFQQSERKYNVTRPVFLERSLHQSKNYWSKLYLRSYHKLLSIGILKSLHRANSSALQDSKLVQVMDKFACYNGSSPFQTSGVMTLMPHIEITIGTYFPVNGMHGITTSLIQLCKDLGIEIHLNTEVSSILTEGKKVNGIQAGEKQILADLVVSNSDVYFTHKQLLKSKKPPKAIQCERSSSVVVFYWGINSEFPQLDLHNMFFSNEYSEEFDAIFQRKVLSKDPSIYVHKSCKIVPSDAPPGKENWFVMLMVPSEPSIIDDDFIAKLRAKTIERLSQQLGTEIEPLIEVEEMLTPQLIQDKTYSYKGALHGTSSNSLFSAFLRHSNFSKSYKNLFFVGGSSHPGGGIPLCLLSAKIATENV